MAKCRLYYDWRDYTDTDEKCEAHLKLNDEVYLVCQGKTFEEAKAKVSARAKALPPDEEIEI